MPKRFLSNLSAAGPAAWSPNEIRQFVDAQDLSEIEGSVCDGLLPLSRLHRTWLAYEVRSGVELSDADFEFFEEVRHRFYRARTRQRAAFAHADVDDRLREQQRALQEAIRVLERSQPIDELVRSALEQRLGRPVVGLRRPLRELERAVGELMARHRQPLLPQSPFEGMVAELSWYWRDVLAIEPVVSNRTPIGAFAPAGAFAWFLRALQMTLPAVDRMHLEGVDASRGGADTWGAFSQAIIRAQRVTAEFQVAGELGRRLAWSLERPYRRR